MSNDSTFIPDYSKYSLSELEDIYSRMQKDMYPERIAAIKEEIKNKKRDFGTNESTTEFADSKDYVSDIDFEKEFENNEKNKSVEKEDYILNEIQKNNKTNPSNYGALILTFVLFIFAGLVNNPVSDLAILVIVLIIHELGHYIAMQLSGYKEIQMFFIPFLGAAVSGKKENPSGIASSIIAFAGPVPGIILSIIILSSNPTNKLIRNFADISLFINVLNLLPIFPLDGGRIIQYNFLRRNGTIEIIYVALSSLLVILTAIFTQDIFIGIFGIFLFFGVFRVEKEWNIISQLKKREIIKSTSFFDLPREQQKIVIKIVLKKFTTVRDNKQYGQIIENVWERYIYKSPELIWSLILLFTYLISLIFLAKFIFGTYT